MNPLAFWLLTLRKPHHVHGIRVWNPLSTGAENAVILRRLDDGLDLLKIYCPVRYERVVRSIRSFLILGKDSLRGIYHQEQRTCQLSEKFLLATDTTLPSIAAAIVHEATHGWLFSLGIPYDEAIRYRVEQICILSALRTAQALPDAEDEIDRCQRQLTLPAEAFTNESYDLLAIKRLQETGAPNWLLRSVIWWLKRKRAA